MILPYDEELVRARQPWLTEMQDVFAREQQQEFEDQLPPFLRDFSNNGMMMKYILTLDYQVVEEPNMFRFSHFMSQDHRVLQSSTLREGPHRAMPDYRPGNLRISTVFVGIARECLFETMIFGGWLDGTQVRSETYKEAMIVHVHALDAALKLNAWVKKNGRKAKKLYVRWCRFWKLTSDRGPNWAMKHEKAGEAMMNAIRAIPGQPPFPEPDVILQIARKFLPRKDFETNDIAL